MERPVMAVPSLPSQVAREQAKDTGPASKEVAHETRTMERRFVFMEVFVGVSVKLPNGCAGRRGRLCRILRPALRFGFRLPAEARAGCRLVGKSGNVQLLPPPGSSSPVITYRSVPPDALGVVLP
jgi:hypothetical protein